MAEHEPNVRPAVSVAVDRVDQPPRLTVADAARIMRAATKDKTYRLFPLGEDAARYLRQKRRRLTDTSYRDYEACLDKLCRHFADLALSDLEPPAGTELVEDFLEHQWGGSAARTYNKNLSILADFFKWAVKKEKLRGSPTLAVERAKKQGVHRTTFTADQRSAILAENPELRDRIALRLLLDYGLRKGALQKIQFKHFDHQRRRLTIFTKGSKVRDVPIPQAAFWHDLGRLLIDTEAQPDHYLLPRQKSIPRERQPDGTRRIELYRFPDRPMGVHGLHDWWYARLAAAGVVRDGVTHGEKMHKARHTAGQRVLDKTGNLKATQRLLGHASMQTTGDIYVDWDLEQLAETLALVVNEEDE